MFDAEEIPFDLLEPIISHLNDRADWHACCLVSKTFHKAATPLLYHTLDSRIISKTLLYHPATTLKERPSLAQYVRHVTETGAVHRGLLPRYPNITQDALSALALCTNLFSLTWIDDSSTETNILLLFLDVIRHLPLRELVIRTHSDLGETVWTQLRTFSGLSKISIWCMEGPPRVLQGWSNTLGKTLTHLELGRCAGVPPTIIITVLSHLNLLTHLRLKGIPSSSILTILTYLPLLQSLDVEYLPSANSFVRRTQSAPVHGQSAHASNPPMPVLRTLTVRTNSMIDAIGPQKLWPWIRQLASRTGLQKFKLHAFSLYSNNDNALSTTFREMGQTMIPRMFMLDLALIHRDSLERFEAAEAGVMMVGDVECLCNVFPKLEVLECAVATRDIASVTQSIRSARNLNTLKLQIQWMPSNDPDPRLSSFYNVPSSKPRFTMDDARGMMLRADDSKLRTVGVGSVLYQGRWVLCEGSLNFEVVENVENDRWRV